MFNLLPNELKDVVRTEYKHREIVLGLIFLVSLLGIFLVMLFPTWFSSLYREKDVRLQADKMNSSLASSNIGPTNELIKSLNQKMQVLNSALEYETFSPLLDALLSQRMSGISIFEITYSAVSNSSATINIKGSASTRDNLVLFSKRLESSSVFKSVNLPISNLAKDKNINFTMTLTASSTKDKQ